jgi:hypothetical protein
MFRKNTSVMGIFCHPLLITQLLGYGKGYKKVDIYSLWVLVFKFPSTLHFLFGQQYESLLCLGTHLNHDFLIIGIYLMFLFQTLLSLEQINRICKLSLMFFILHPSVRFQISIFLWHLSISSYVPFLHLENSLQI